MKLSLKKLRGLALPNRNDLINEKRNRYHNPAPLDELEQTSQDMQDMRNCYDSLFSAAAVTVNSAFEFSESMKDMGGCLLEKTAMNDDEENGSVLLMLGKVQFELQKLVDRYRSHVIQTISTPSESLLNELTTLEEMKKRCDDKRDLFDHMLATQKEKGKSKNIKTETFSTQQIQVAREEYDDEATLFVFRLKSLKQGQSRSLLTQAARHHAAQLAFFRNGIKSLEAIEPHVKLVAEKEHIDYQFSGLDDNETEEDNYGYDLPNDDSELSFDYGQNDQNQEVSTSRNSMELDQMDNTIPETSQDTLDKRQGDSFLFSKGTKLSSQSAPIFPENKFDPAEKLEMRSSASKFHTYVLPTPLDCKPSVKASLSPAPPVARGLSTNMWHSSPLVPDKGSDNSKDCHSLSPAKSLNTRSVLHESNINFETNIPPPLQEGLSFPRRYDKKIKRHAFSGPLSGKGWSGSAKPFLSASQEYFPMVSPAPMRVPAPKPSTSPKVSPTASFPLIRPSPKISELHELPRPPLSSAKPTRPPSLIGHSAPLGSRGPEISTMTKSHLVSSPVASPLPMPPGTMSRSFSIPSNRQRATSLTVGKPLEVHDSDIAKEISSPTLTPISLVNRRPTPRAFDLDGPSLNAKSYCSGHCFDCWRLFR